MGATEIIFVFVIYLLFFGAKGIPSLAKTMGKAMYQFREARNDIQREIMDSAKDITDSAKEVRREVENAAKLAEKQAKKAQDYVKNPLEPSSSKDVKKTTSEKTPVNTPKEETINPLTPGDSISSSGYANGTASTDTPDETAPPKDPIT